MPNRRLSLDPDADRKRIKTESLDEPEVELEPVGEPSAGTGGKACIVCYETSPSFPKISAACKGKHTNEVCTHCWNRYLRSMVMPDISGAEECVQCDSILYPSDIKRILSRKDFAHYEYLLRRIEALINGERECLADVTDTGGNEVTCHYFWKHDEGQAGRISHCPKCQSLERLVCGVREHTGESCEAFQARLREVHGHEEAKSAEALQNGVQIHFLTESGRPKSKVLKPIPCPSCGLWISRDGKCAHMTCPKCANQFCFNCLAPYYGPDSVPALGNAAHQEWCCYYQRENEDRRFVRKKKDQDVEVETEGEVKEEAIGEVKTEVKIDTEEAIKEEVKTEVGDDDAKR